MVLQLCKYLHLWCYTYSKTYTYGIILKVIFTLMVLHFIVKLTLIIILMLLHLQ